MLKTHHTEFPIDSEVPVYHFGIPDKMKVIAYDHDKKLVKLQYLVPPFGTDFKSVDTLNRMAQQCATYKKPGSSI